MPTHLVYSEGHHSVERSEFRSLIDVPEGADPDYLAFLAVLDFACTCDGLALENGPEQSCCSGNLRTMVEQCKGGVHEAAFRLKDDDGDEHLFAFWYYEKDSQHGGKNLGFGRSSDGTVAGTCKRENWWVHASLWQPDEQRRQALLQLSTKELADMILRMEATS